MIENANASTKIFTHTFDDDDDDDDLRAQTHSEYLLKKKLTQTAKEAQTFLEKTGQQTPVVPKCVGKGFWSWLDLAKNLSNNPVFENQEKT